MSNPNSIGPRLSPQHLPQSKIQRPQQGQSGISGTQNKSNVAPIHSEPSETIRIDGNKSQQGPVLMTEQDYINAAMRRRSTVDQSSSNSYWSSSQKISSQLSTIDENPVKQSKKSKKSKKNRGNFLSFLKIKGKNNKNESKSKKSPKLGKDDQQFIQNLQKSHQKYQDQKISPPKSPNPLLGDQTHVTPRGDELDENEIMIISDGIEQQDPNQETRVRRKSSHFGQQLQDKLFSSNLIEEDLVLQIHDDEINKGKGFTPGGGYLGSSPEIQKQKSQSVESMQLDVLQESLPMQDNADQLLTQVKSQIEFRGPVFVREVMVRNTSNMSTDQLQTLQGTINAMAKDDNYKEDKQTLMSMSHSIDTILESREDGIEPPFNTEAFTDKLFDQVMTDVNASVPDSAISMTINSSLSSLDTSELENLRTEVGNRRDMMKELSVQSNDLMKQYQALQRMFTLVDQRLT